MQELNTFKYSNEHRVTVVILSISNARIKFVALREVSEKNLLHLLVLQ